MQTEMSTGLAAAAVTAFDQCLGHLTLVTGAYHFFSSASLSSSLPGISSAGIRLIRAFSFLSSLNCLPWSKSSIPNFRFQRWKVCSLIYVITATLQDRLLTARGFPQNADLRFNGSSLAFQGLIPFYLIRLTFNPAQFS